MECNGVSRHRLGHPHLVALLDTWQKQTFANTNTCERELPCLMSAHVLIFLTSGTELPQGLHYLGLAQAHLWLPVESALASPVIEARRTLCGVPGLGKARATTPALTVQAASLTSPDSTYSLQSTLCWGIVLNSDRMDGTIEFFY
jgi:hypothetical protein